MLGIQKNFTSLSTFLDMNEIPFIKFNEKVLQRSFEVQLINCDEVVRKVSKKFRKSWKNFCNCCSFVGIYCREFENYFYDQLLRFLGQLSYAGNIDINNPLNGCPKGQMNMSAKVSCCTNMNKIRRPFKECCLYPLLVIWRWQFDLCVAKCNDDLSSYTSSSYRCCVLPCCFTYLKVIDAHPEINGIMREGVKYSFMLSVANETK